MSMTIQQHLYDLEEARSMLDPYTRLPEEYVGELRRHALVQSVHYSTRLEGNTLTLEQVRDSLAGETVPSPRGQIQEVRNYREAMDYVQSLTTGGTFQITRDVLRTIHYLVSKSLPGKYAPGQYRSDQNYVVDRTTTRRMFLPPSPGDVPGLMDELVAWLNRDQEIPVPIKAALAGLNLVAIHPFLDGNGRAARLTDSLALYQGGFKAQELVSLEAYLGRDTLGYYRALASALGVRYAPPGDCTVWIEYYLHAHVEQARVTIREVAEQVREFDGLAEAFRPESLSVWQLVALWVSCRRGHISNRAYRSITGRSPQSAVSDFSVLMEKGGLVRVGRGRGVSYVPSDRVLQVYDAIREEISLGPDSL